MFSFHEGAFSASIDNNVITIIPTSALTEMRELRITVLDSLEDLSNNQIQTLEESTLSGLTSVKHLLLGHNKIHTETLNFKYIRVSFS